MRKLVGLSMLAVLLFASMAGAVPDPWRLKVSDLDKNNAYATFWIADITTDTAVGTWGSSGGKFRVYSWFGDYGTQTLVASYSASTGALSFGDATTTSIETWGSPSLRDVIKVGSVYKLHRWDAEYHGQDIRYATSTDGANFSVWTRCTIYGPTVTSTGTYGLGGSRTSAGVYVFSHRNSGAAYQSAGSLGICTSGVGETEWWDIDTSDPDPVMPGPYGFNDPICDPHTLGTYYREMNNYQSIAKACDGNLFSPQGSFNEYTQFGGLWEMGVGLVIATAGEAVGGDHYVWISDADNTNTQGIGNSLLGGVGLNGVGGPSLRGAVNGYWTGWVPKVLPLASGGDMAPSARFAMFYSAGWDTDSSGSGYDVIGMGRATVYMTRNNADLNMDGTVNFSDIAPFSTAYGSTSGVSANYNGDADFNHDGKVDFKDISPLSTRYGSNCSYGSP